jgi:hypothetical protein
LKLFVTAIVASIISLVAVAVGDFRRFDIALLAPLGPNRQRTTSTSLSRPKKCPVDRSPIIGIRECVH